MGRLLPGNQVTVAQESISGKLLVDLGIIDPDFLPTIFSMYQEVAPTIALLDTKGYKTTGINYGTNWLTDGGRFRTVSSNHIQYRIAADDWRVERFRPNASGYTFEDGGNPSYPGLGKNWFYIYLDSNWAGGNEVLLLADGKTQLWIMDKDGGVEVSGGVWRYRVKVNGNNPDDYASPDLMQDGDECQVVYSQYRQDWSTGGNEKHTFGGFGDSYLSLQRFKYSYSGTAAAMDRNKKVTGRWVQAGDYKGGKTFISMAQEEMMKMVAKYADFQIMEGKGSVDTDTKKIQLTDSEYQEVLTGSGILYSGDGPIEFPMNNGWSEAFIEAFLADVDTYIRPNESGTRELALEMHPTSYLNFQKAMLKMGATQDNNIEGSGSNKIVNNTYAGFELGGIRLMAHRSTRLSGRPGKVLKDGTRSNEWDVLCYPLGLTPGGDRGIQLIQLRPMVNGKVAGIDAGGNVSNDIDGSTEHVLIQMGVISQVQCMKIYRPLTGNIL